MLNKPNSTYEFEAADQAKHIVQNTFFDPL